MSVDLMYDAATAANIPADATEVAGYVDGDWAWSESDWARFVDATLKVRITVKPMNLDADVCDVENGAYTAQLAAQWCRARIKLGERPCVYATPTTWNSVVWELATVGVAQTSVDWWAADWTNNPYLYAGSKATQFEGNAPGGYDLDETAPGWRPSTTESPTPTPPAPAPSPLTHLEDDPMLLVNNVEVNNPEYKEGVYDITSGPPVFVGDVGIINEYVARYGRQPPEVSSNQLINYAQARSHP